MRTIAERLREWSDDMDGNVHKLHDEAADEIERLQFAIEGDARENLIEAIAKVIDPGGWQVPEGEVRTKRIGRRLRALAKAEAILALIFKADAPGTKVVGPSKSKS